MKNNTFILLLIILSLGACQSKKELSLATGSQESTHFRVGTRISQLIATQSQEYLITLMTEGAGSKSNLENLLEEKVDFALVQNDIEIKKDLSKIRTVLPLYPQVLFIIYDPEIEANSLAELVRGRKIAVGPKTGGTVVFVEQLLQSYGIGPNAYELVYGDYKDNVISDSVPISISLTAPNNLRIAKMILKRKGKIWSLDEPQNLGQGTSVEGFCLINPLAHPFIIPKNTFNQYPKEAILTVAVYNLLVTSEETDPSTVYSLVKTILENKEILSSKDIRFRFLNENFIADKSFKFPLHKGTRQYLSRKEPGFFERYAELVGVLITAATIFIGGLSSLIGIGRRRRKNLIDNYYLKVIEIENIIKETEDKVALQNYLDSLTELRQDAFKALVKERLGADESFRIFTDFLADVMQQIKNRLDD